MSTDNGRVRMGRLRGVPQIPEKIHELTVGQLAERSGAAVSALHFYESKGLISSRRTAGNQRRYHRDTLRRVAFVRAAQRYVPDLALDDVLAGPSGVRAQALGRDGALVDDFVVSHTERALHVRNAPSPAATSSLAIARLIADRAEQAFDLGPR